jgi:hypothetical protein
MIKLASKEEILAKVQQNAHEWIDSQQFVIGKRIQHDDWKEWADRRRKNQYTADELEEAVVDDSYETVENDNDGDGREQRRTYHFKDYDLYVSLVGTYSSHGDCYWNDVFVSEPYEYTETRYKKKS